MNKTLEEIFIDSMPADIAAMAIRNTDESLLNIEIDSSPDQALHKAFYWANSEQGGAFWIEVYSALKGEIDFRDLDTTKYEQAIAGLEELHAELLKDRKRLDWLIRDTIFLSEISTREKIDEAMEAEWYERERHDKIMSGMDNED